MLTREQAQLLADRWMSDTGDDRSVWLYEFDEGWVVLPVEPRAADGRGVIDQVTGEITVWPNGSADTVAGAYHAHLRRHPRAPRTWDPQIRVRYALTRQIAPATAAHLVLADGTLHRGISMKGDGQPNYHPLVLDLVLSLPPEDQERGYERCAEVDALSDALHAEDARRAKDGRPAVTIDMARTSLFAGARLTTYKVRERGDSAGGDVSVPCVSCFELYDRFGFALDPPLGMIAPGGGPPRLSDQPKGGGADD